MKLKEIRGYRNIGQAEFAKKVGTTSPMMSNFENYKCIPVPNMLKRMCDILECRVSDIYEDEEIYIKKNNNLITRVRKQKQEYKLTVSLPEEARGVFTPVNLRKCGYHSLKDFIWHCYKRFEKQLAIINKKTIIKK